MSHEAVLETNETWDTDVAWTSMFYVVSIVGGTTSK